MRRAQYFKQMVPDSIKEYLPKTSTQAALKALKFSGFLLLLSAMMTAGTKAHLVVNEESGTRIADQGSAVIASLIVTSIASLSLAAALKAYAELGRYLKDSDLIARFTKYVTNLTTKQQRSLKATAKRLQSKGVEPEAFGLKLSQAIMGM